MAAEPGVSPGLPSKALPDVVHIPFVELLGLTLTRLEEGASEMTLDLRPELCNSWQVAHGGTVMTMLDVTMAHATRLPPKGAVGADGAEAADRQGVITIEMKTTFMRPGLGRLVCRGRLLHRTRGLSFCEADIINPAGELVAHATGTFKNRKPASAGTESKS